MNIDVILHVPHEGLGNLEKIIKSYGDTINYHKLWEEPDILNCLDGNAISHLIVMGGPMSANDDLPWLQQERDLIKAVHHHGGSILGICLGAQQIAKAFDGRVSPMHFKELGWFPVESTVDDLPSGTVFQWHGDKMEIPDIAQQIYTDDICPAQGFRIGDKIYALQFHPEMTPESLQKLLTADANYLDDPSNTVQDRNAIFAFDTDSGQGAHIAKMIYDEIR